MNFYLPVILIYDVVMNEGFGDLFQGYDLLHGKNFGLVGNSGSSRNLAEGSRMWHKWSETIKVP